MKFEKEYYNFFESIFKDTKLVRLCDVDFDKSWLDIFWKRKEVVSLSLVFWILSLIWDGVAPVIIGFAFSQQDFGLLILTLVIYLIRYLISALSLFLAVGFEKSIIYSIKTSASKFFLSVDPFFHTTKSSGQIQSKVDRCSDGYQTIIVNVLFKILPAIISPITSIIIILGFDARIGLISMSISVFMVLVTYYLTIINAKIVTPIFIKKEDKFKESQIESLYQNTYIRSVFGTPDSFKKVSTRGLDSAYSAAINNFSSIFLMTISRVILWFNVAVVAVLLYNSSSSGEIDIAVVIGILTSFIFAQNDLVDLGLYIDRLSKSYYGIVDLYKFVRSFGKQSYPALDEKR